MLATTKLVVEEMEAGTNIKGLKDHDIVDFELWVFYFCVIFHSSPSQLSWVGVWDRSHDRGLT